MLILLGRGLQNICDVGVGSLMREVKLCKTCGKEFETYYKGIYCSDECYRLFRWRNNDGKCKLCGKIAKFRYCSSECRRDFWNKNDYHLNRKYRMWERKMALIKELGGRCSSCEEDDFRLLEINHIDRSKKVQPKHRCYTMWNRLREWGNNKSNLQLLCANCHRRHTWEQMGYGNGLRRDYVELAKQRLSRLK